MTNVANRLDAAARGVDRVNAVVGSVVRWLAVAMVLVQFTIVVLRYLFGTSFIWASELELYLHATLFMAGAGFTLLVDGHVRVDIFYGSMGRRARAWVNLLGTVLLLVPTGLVLLWFTWTFVTASWAVLEGPISVGGIPASFLLKSLLPLFAGLILIQGIAMALRAAAELAGGDAPPPPVGLGGGT